MYALLAALACAGPPEASIDLADHRWTHRVLLVFAPSPDHPALRQQEAALAAHAEGVGDRRLVIERAVGEEAADLRARFDVEPDGFTTILVGLDGTEKRRASEPLEARALFETIDAMPMRRRELREREAASE